MLYRPPGDVCSEFEVERTTLPPNTGAYSPPILPCGYILLLLSGSSCTVSNTTTGESISLQVGTVMFIAANTPLSIDGGAEGVQLYRAHVNLGTSDEKDSSFDSTDAESISSDAKRLRTV